MCKIPSEQNRQTMAVDSPIRVPPLPVYVAPEGCTSLSEALVNFEAYLLDESGEQAKYAYLLDLAERRRDEEVAELKRLQAEAALAEERLRREASALQAAMMRVHDRLEVDESDEESELDSGYPATPSSSSSSSSSYSLERDVTPFQPRTMNLKVKKPRSTRTVRKESKPYSKPPSTPRSDSDSEAPRPDFVEFYTPCKDPAVKKYRKKVLRENEYWVHCIDWANDPPTWDGEAIPPMAADDVTTWINDVYGGKVCKMGACLFAENPREESNLKAHILASRHLNLRIKCQICRFTCRGDMFDERHAAQKCPKLKRKNAEAIRKEPGLPTPSYTWERTDFVKLKAMKAKSA